MTQDRESLIEQRLSGMAATIRSQIPGAQVRLYSCGEAFGYGSWARGQAGPESDIDLLITVPDAWLDQHNRWRTLSELRRSLAMADASLDLLLFSEREVAERLHWRSHVIARAYREGLLLDGAL
jgi:predicted nucleotidyltransferase